MPLVVPGPGPVGGGEGALPWRRADRRIFAVGELLDLGLRGVTFTSGNLKELNGDLWSPGFL